MKKILVIFVALLFVMTYASAEIIKSEGEIRIGNAIKQIHSQISSAKISIGNIYDRAKDYTQDHPTQFDANDKTKLNGLATHILDVKSKVDDLKTYIDTNWPGLTK